MDDTGNRVHETLAAINQAWRENRPSDMKDHLHPDVTMALLWVFEQSHGRWIAVWRTMVEVQDERQPGA